VPFRERYAAVVVAVRRRGRREPRLGRFEHVVLEAGDVLLMCVERRSMPELERRGDFLLTSELALTSFRRRHMPAALGILVGVVAVATTGLLPIASAAMIGAVLTLVTGCLRLDEAVESVDWNVMLLLAGVLSLGTALESSGGAARAAQGFVDALGGASPRVVIGALFAATTLITSVLSNNATAALLTPVALGIAANVDLDPRPFIMAVMFGASTSMLTPVGYQTNTMVYGAGYYRFGDFVRVGGPLTLALALVAAFAIPLVWPP
jgi:di/tricarboxylate transporter